MFNATSAAASQGCPDRADDLLAAARAAAVRSGAARVDETGVFGRGWPRCRPSTRRCASGSHDRAMQLVTPGPHTAGIVPGFWESGHTGCTSPRRHR